MQRGSSRSSRQPQCARISNTYDTTISRYHIGYITDLFKKKDGDSTLVGRLPCTPWTCTFGPSQPNVSILISEQFFAYGLTVDVLAGEFCCAPITLLI
jgi:hypothetical protein